MPGPLELASTYQVLPPDDQYASQMRDAVPGCGVDDKFFNVIVTASVLPPAVACQPTPVRSAPSTLPPAGFVRIEPGASPAASTICGPGQLVPCGGVNDVHRNPVSLLPFHADAPVFCRV